MLFVPTADAASCPSINRTLERGVTGDDVRSVQEFLQGTGDFTFDDITDFYGPVTEAAVQRYQCRHGIVCTGTPASHGYGAVGPRTRAHMAQLCVSSSGSVSSVESSGDSVVTPDQPVEPVVVVPSVVEVVVDETPVVVGNACNARTLTARQRTLIESLDKHLETYDTAYSLSSNRAGILGNNEPAYLEALLDAYQATHQDKYLQKFVVHADRVLAQRDDVKGYRDYRNRSGATWSNAAYSAGGQHVSFLIEDASLIAPLAHFAAIVKESPCLSTLRDAKGRTFSGIGQDLARAAGETVAFHQPQWHTIAVNGEQLGYYTTADDVNFVEAEVPGMPVPVNYQSAMGAAVAYLYRATGDTTQLDRAERLGRYVLREMLGTYRAASDSYAWPMWPQMPYATHLGMQRYTNLEDLSHGIITVEFARALRDSGSSVFSSEHLTRIAHAYSRALYRAGDIPMSIDGTGPSAGGQLYQFARAAALAPYDPALWAAAYDVGITRLQTQREGNSGSVGAVSGIARLIRYDTAAAAQPAAAPTAPVVVQPQVPRATVTFTANNSSNSLTISAGQVVTYAWQSTGTTHCVFIGPSGTASFPATHSFTTNPYSLVGNHVITLKCPTGVNGESVSAVLALTVLPLVTSSVVGGDTPQAQPVRFTANGQSTSLTINAGEAVTYVWDSTDTSACTFIGPSGTATFPAKHSFTTNPYSLVGTHTITLNCALVDGGSTSASLTLTVRSVSSSVQQSAQLANVAVVLQHLIDTLRELTQRR
ncbi:MAG: peptidoglycan-binding protein [Candidatus Pacebacteria bacterium]|nr:peptidoglycan-binding protein [Candidatus Paceibacterota bacterium]